MQMLLTYMFFLLTEYATIEAMLLAGNFYVVIFILVIAVEIFILSYNMMLSAKLLYLKRKKLLNALKLIEACKKKIALQQASNAKKAKSKKRKTKRKPKKRSKSAEMTTISKTLIIEDITNIYEDRRAPVVHAQKIEEEKEEVLNLSLSSNDEEVKVNKKSNKKSKRVEEYRIDNFLHIER
jgi:hypothetical protein